MIPAPGECLLYVPQDLPAVGAPQRTAHTACAAYDLARLVPGRTLMLVPSVTALIEARCALAGRDPVAWYQGMLPFDGERAGFEANPRGFLMVLPTWLGENPIQDLDVSCLVLEHLPLDAQPPVGEDQGLEPSPAARPDFLGSVLPQAINTVSRLAAELATTYPPRATVLAIMDERITDRSWGRLFLHSLPDVVLGRDLEDVVSYYCRMRAARRG